MARTVKIKRDGVLVDMPLHEARRYGQHEPSQSAPVERQGTAVPLDVSAVDRHRETCQACEHSADMQDYSCHCRKKGNRPSCARCRALFTGRASQCPLGLWE